MVSIILKIIIHLLCSTLFIYFSDSVLLPKNLTKHPKIQWLKTTIYYSFSTLWVDWAELGILNGFSCWDCSHWRLNWMDDPDDTLRWLAIDAGHTGCSARIIGQCAYPWPFYMAWASNRILRRPQKEHFKSKFSKTFRQNLQGLFWPSLGSPRTPHQLNFTDQASHQCHPTFGRRIRLHPLWRKWQSQCRITCEQGNVVAAIWENIICNIGIWKYFQLFSLALWW